VNDISPPPSGRTPPQFSPDGRWWWNGAQWISASMIPTKPSDIAMSPEAGVAVPGGIVMIDPLRGRSKLGFWLRASAASLFSYTFSTASMKRDIVVLDQARDSVLYREGPYDGKTVSAAFAEIVRQINSVGLDQFKTMRGREAVDSGPRTQLRTTAIPTLGAEQALEYYAGRLRSLFRRRGHP
jgi:hypothetical protein